MSRVCMRSCWPALCPGRRSSPSPSSSAVILCSFEKSLLPDSGPDYFKASRANFSNIELRVAATRIGSNIFHITPRPQTAFLPHVCARAHTCRRALPVSGYRIVNLAQVNSARSPLRVGGQQTGRRMVAIQVRGFSAMLCGHQVGAIGVASAPRAPRSERFECCSMLGGVGDVSATLEAVLGEHRAAAICFVSSSHHGVMASFFVGGAACRDGGPRREFRVEVPRTPAPRSSKSPLVR